MQTADLLTLQLTCAPPLPRNAVAADQILRIVRIKLRVERDGRFNLNRQEIFQPRSFLGSE